MAGEAFLAGHIRFTDITDVIALALDGLPLHHDVDSLAAVLHTDAQVRVSAGDHVRELTARR